MGVQKNKILIFGATGYLGKHLIKESISMGNSTYAYVRPITPETDLNRLQILKDFESMGVIVYQGELDEHGKLVEVLKEVDVVISAVAVPQHLEQLKIISAMKEAGNIKRFVPSEFGNEVDRACGALPPFQTLLDNKKKIRRATEKAGIPFTYVSANSFAAYFVSYLLHPHDNSDEVTIFGNGEAKAVLNYEEDIANYTLQAAVDPRTANRVIIYRPPNNIVSQIDLINAWERKTTRTMKRIHVTEQQIIDLIQNLANPDKIPLAIIHNIFIVGAQMNFELTDEDLECSKLYPDHNYTSVDQLLDRFLIHPPKPKFATFC